MRITICTIPAPGKLKAEPRNTKKQGAPCGMRFAACQSGGTWDCSGDRTVRGRRGYPTLRHRSGRAPRTDQHRRTSCPIHALVQRRHILSGGVQSTRGATDGDGLARRWPSISGVFLRYLASSRDWRDQMGHHRGTRTTPAARLGTRLNRSGSPHAQINHIAAAGCRQLGNPRFAVLHARQPA